MKYLSVSIDEKLQFDAHAKIPSKIPEISTWTFAIRIINKNY